MSVVMAWLNSPEVESFVFALLHSLWQGGVWVGILLGSYRLIPASRNALRHGAAIGCLLGLVWNHFSFSTRQSGGSAGRFAWNEKPAAMHSRQRSFPKNMCMPRYLSERQYPIPLPRYRLLS